MQPIERRAIREAFKRMRRWVIDEMQKRDSTTDTVSLVDLIRIIDEVEQREWPFTVEEEHGTEEEED